MNSYGKNMHQERDSLAEKLAAMTKERDQAKVDASIATIKSSQKILDLESKLSACERERDLNEANLFKLSEHHDKMIKAFTDEIKSLKAKLEDLCK